MFNWLGNLFPYSDLHSLNLDWILNKMKETAAQAAQAIADSAKALAQVIEAKTAAQVAQTAANNAQTAANNAQTAANNAADSAENAVNVAQQAKSAAQTAQNTANTAQSAAQTAQSAAQTAQSDVEAANTEIGALKAHFPIQANDIASSAVTVVKLATTTSYLFPFTTSITSTRFPKSGSASIDQITAGIVSSNSGFLHNLNTKYLQLSMDITEPGATEPNTVFACNAPIIHYTKKSEGLIAIAQIIVIKQDTNDAYNGFIKISRTGEDLYPECKVIFETVPPFNNNTGFVIKLDPIAAKISLNI